MCALKILPVEKIREADACTIAYEPILSIDLMERAAKKCFDWIIAKSDKLRPVKVICGTGNNGGDGLAIARMLHYAGYIVEVFVIRFSNSCSGDFSHNFKRLADLPGLVISDIYESDPSIELTEDDLVIDAIFGSGLNRSPEGLSKEIIKQINSSGALVVSIDIPSGLFADSPSDLRSGGIVQADYTLTFQFPRKAFLAPENEIFTGKWEVLDIGLSSDFIESAECNEFFIEKEDCTSLYRPRPKFAHKGNFGHALLIAGRSGLLGAAVMASESCLRSGAGLLTTHIPADGFLVMQTALPEAMVSIDADDECFTSLPVLDVYSAIGAGPGLGTSPGTSTALKLLIQQAAVPLVLDADALNILSENKTWLSFVPPGTILTPHPGEFERLAGRTANFFDRIELLKAFSQRYQVFVILKGAYSVLSTPNGGLYVNSTGNPGMATGGSGDVLTGIILGLLAQKYPARDACILAMWLHGKAGDIAAKKHGFEAMLAGDIIRNLGKAFKKLY